MSDDAIHTAIGLWEGAHMHVTCVENLPANLVAMTYAAGQVKGEPHIIRCWAKWSIIHWPQQTFPADWKYQTYTELTESTLMGWPSLAHQPLPSTLWLLHTQLHNSSNPEDRDWHQNTIDKVSERRSPLKKGFYASNNNDTNNTSLVSQHIKDLQSCTHCIFAHS